MLAYLATLNPVADHALLDAMSRWWEMEDSESTVEDFAKVGLRVIDTSDDESDDHN